VQTSRHGHSLTAQTWTPIWAKCKEAWTIWLRYGTLTVMTTISVPDGRGPDLDVSRPEDGIPLVFWSGIPGSVRQLWSMGGPAVGERARAHGRNCAHAPRVDPRAAACVDEAPPHAVLERGRKQKVARVLGTTLSPWEALMGWIERFTDFVGTKRGLASALHSGDPAYGDLPQHLLDRLEPALQTLLTRAVDGGYARRRYGSRSPHDHRPHLSAGPQRATKLQPAHDRSVLGRTEVGHNSSRRWADRAAS